MPAPLYRGVHAVTRVGLLAPMRQELAPLVRRLGLVRSDAGRFSGRVGRVEVVAALAGIGTRAATQACEALLDASAIDHVMVVGIAGGVDPAQPIGARITPALVVNADTGAAFEPVQLTERPAHGRLLTSDHLVADPEEGERLRQSGVVGLDMETAAVAAVCVRRGVAWSVFRAISDRVCDGMADAGVLALAGSDGAGEPRAVARYLLARPWRVVRLARLAAGTRRAAAAAAEDAARACARLE